MDSFIIAIIINIQKAFGNVRFFPALLRLLCNYRGPAPGPGELERGRGGVERWEKKKLRFAERQVAIL